MTLIDALSAEIGRALGRPFHADASVESGGGCINRALTLRGRTQRWFVKVNDANLLPMFEAERDGLAALEAAGAFRIPHPLCCGIAAKHAYLVLEHLELQPVGERADAIAFGRALAALHRDSALAYGWQCDNFIGATPQVNTQCESWAQFFATMRLRPQLAYAAANGYGHALRDRGERLAERLHAFFVGYQPVASLLHGDLWHGNAARLADGTPVIFDPAVYRGDRETDLAMTELFGGFPTAFYAAYREAWPLADGYETRKTLYNVYHILNHLNLFGRAYLGQAQRMIDRLLAELRG